MPEEKIDNGMRTALLTAFVSESQDRERNTLYVASICDNSNREIVAEFSDYGLKELEEEISRRYPDVEIEHD